MVGMARDARLMHASRAAAWGRQGGDHDWCWYDRSQSCSCLLLLLFTVGINKIFGFLAGRGILPGSKPQATTVTKHHRWSLSTWENGRLSAPLDPSAQTTLQGECDTIKRKSIFDLPVKPRQKVSNTTKKLLSLKPRGWESWDGSEWAGRESEIKVMR